MTQLRTIVAALALTLGSAACGGSSKPVDTPATPTTAGSAAAADTGLLGIGEIAISDKGQAMLKVHASGDVEIDDGGSWKTIGKLSTDGKLVTTTGQTGQLNADGTFTSPDGTAPFKLDGAALVAGGKRLTIENGKLVGASDAATTVTITGAETDGTKRTTLLLLGLLLGGDDPSAAAGSASVSVPPMPPPSPAPAPPSK